MTDNYRRARDIQPAPTRVRDVSQAGHPAVKSVLAFLSALIIVVSGIGYFSVGRLGNELSASDLEIGGGKKSSKGASGSGTNTLDGAMDILLVGSDSRTDAQGNPLSEEELARLNAGVSDGEINTCLLYTSPSPRDKRQSRMPSSA